VAAVVVVAAAAEAAAVEEEVAAAETRVGAMRLGVADWRGGATTGEGAGSCSRCLRRADASFSSCSCRGCSASADSTSTGGAPSFFSISLLSCADIASPSCTPGESRMRASDGDRRGTDQRGCVVCRVLVCARVRVVCVCRTSLGSKWRETAVPSVEQQRRV
jgi:hypothetical protein